MFRSHAIFLIGWIDLEDVYRTATARQTTSNYWIGWVAFSIFTFDRWLKFGSLLHSAFFFDITVFSLPVRKSAITMSAGLTIGGWFAQAFIQTLADKASSYFLQHSWQSYDLRHDLRELSFSLKTAREVLCLAEQRGTANKHDDLARLAAQLRGAVYDAEDLLGDLDYEALSRKIEGGQAGDPPTCFPSPPADIFSLGDDDIEYQLREVGDRLDRTAKELRDFLNSEQDQTLPVERERETSSFLTVPKVFGREDEKESIVQVLLSGSSGVSFSVLPIIGAVGVGKTTLAQCVYNDPRVGRHFSLKMWVFVSHFFDVKRLTKQMIESATGKMQADLSLDSLQAILQKKVIRQRFLLVLDDVREDDTEEWQLLCAPLRQGRQGSMILVTTRSRRVADVMGTMEPMHLQGLSDDDCWKLLKSRAFNSEKKLAVPSDLEAVGTNMTAKLKGSPSAAISLASRLSRLNEKIGAGDWRRIMNKEMWESQQDGIMEPLRSSYQYLPGHLKRCFSFCSIFPKEYPFNQHELVGVWAAQGFIASQETTQMEDVGTRYLHDLINMFFFQYTQWDHRQYVIPDLMHELAYLVSKEECFMLQDKCYHGMPSTIRHLSVCAENMELNKLKGLGRNSKLRSLLIFENTMPNLNVAINYWFDQLKYIRLLNLRYCKIDELPESIGNLKHLRYLDISWTRIKKLPETLCLLFNLQVLNIWGCSLESFPEGFTKLINLRFLDVEVNLISKITKIGKLTSLQELRQFQVLKKDGHRIGELKDLSQLRERLHIKNLENVESEEYALQAKLDNKEYVDELFLEWSSGRSNFAFDMEVLECLRPHRNLKQLEIRRYGGERSPSWLHRTLLPYISKLHIENCPNLKEIPCLPLVLTELRLIGLGLDTLPRLWDEGSSGVGSSSQGSNSIKSSSLSKLHIERFPRLTSLEQWLLPLHLPKIESIQIINCEELMSVPVESFKSFDRLKDLTISNCPKLTCMRKLVLPLSTKRFMLDACGGLDNSLPGCLKRLTSLTVMRLRKCPHIIYLPRRVLADLTSLESLYISDCPAIISLGGLEALVSLRNLTILKCYGLKIYEPLMSNDEVNGQLMMLQELEIDETTPSKLSFLYKLQLSSFVLVISESAESVLFAGEEADWLQVLRSVEKLWFKRCTNLQSLPTWLSSLPFLKRLWITDCPNINSPLDNALRTSLDDGLYVNNCGPILMGQLQRQKH